MRTSEPNASVYQLPRQVLCFIEANQAPLTR